MWVLTQGPFDSSFAFLLPVILAQLVKIIEKNRSILVQFSHVPKTEYLCLPWTKSSPKISLDVSTRTPKSPDFHNFCEVKPRVLWSSAFSSKIIRGSAANCALLHSVHFSLALYTCYQFEEELWMRRHLFNPSHLIFLEPIICLQPPPPSRNTQGMGRVGIKNFEDNSYFSFLLQSCL